MDNNLKRSELKFGVVKGEASADRFKKTFKKRKKEEQKLLRQHTLIYSFLKAEPHLIFFWLAGNNFLANQISRNFT
jgi:hypothetical protein